MELRRQWSGARQKKVQPGGRIDARYYAAARCGVFFLLGTVTACARVMSEGAPFGMAMVACAGPGAAGVCALAGAALGYLVSGGIDWGIRYIAAAVLVYTVAFVFQEVTLYKSKWFMPCAAALIMVLTGFLGSFSVDEELIPLIARLFLETSLAFAAAYFFHDALCDTQCDTEQDEIRRSFATVILSACILMAFSRIVVLNVVSLGRFLAVLLVMSSAMRGGMLTGAAVGTLLGLAMDIAGGGVPFYTPVYALAGLLSGVFGRHGRTVYVLSYVLASALGVACVWDAEMYLGAMFETFCASVVFMLLPTPLLNTLGLMLQCCEKGSGESGLRRFVSKRVQGLSDAYGQLYRVLEKSIEEPSNDNNIARVFDRAADAVCVGCTYKNRCWNSDYMDTLSALNDATQAMQERGFLEAEDIPGFFRKKCTKLTAFITAVNAELRSLAFRKQARTRLAESKSVAWGQYSDISDVLGGVAQELGSSNGADHLAERRLARYLRGLDIDADTCVYRDGGGRLRAVIESGRLTPLMAHEDYLDRLSGVVGVRLCQPQEPGEGAAKLTLLEAEPLAVSVGIAALKKRGEKISGDKGTYFKTDAGVLCVILSDGMGCGDEAAKESSEVVSILEKFLRAGVDPAVAMKILNSVMLLRAGDGWGYATVDLMCVDLFTGETCFYKYGAAPSYVKSDGSIRRIKGETLAAGLNTGRGLEPDLVRMKLSPGCTALIASDGVLADSEDEWLKALLQKNCDDMKELAKSALKEAERIYGLSDDMTVVTVKVEERT